MTLQSLLAGLRPGDLFSTSHPRSPEKVEASRVRLQDLFPMQVDLPEHEDLDTLEELVRRALG